MSPNIEETNVAMSDVSNFTAGSKIDRPVETLSSLQRIRLLFSRSIEVWVAQRASSKGAALAFYTLFSISPILILVLTIAGALVGPEAARGEIFVQIKGLVGPSGAQAIQAVLASTQNSKSGGIATLIASALLFIGATTVFAELKDSLDDMWQVPKKHSSGIGGLIRTRVLSLGLILVLAFLLMVSLVLSAGLAILERYWGGLWHTTNIILQWIASLFSFGVITCMFAVIYKTLPQIRLSWHDVWIGAVGTAVLFIVGKYLIGLYLGNSAVASSFGAAGSVVALLLWIYYSSQIFFLGAEFTRQYTLIFGSLSDRA